MSRCETATSSRIRRVIKSAYSFCAPATLSISLSLKSARRDMSVAPKNGGIAHANALGFELEIRAHSPAFERNRHVLRLRSHELVDELTQTPGGLAIVDIRAAQSVARHGVRHGISRILDDGRAAAHFDPAQACAAVIQFRPTIPRR